MTISKIISGTESRKRNLLLPISPTTWVRISTVVIPCGIKVGTIKTAKANLPEKRLLIQILISICTSISIFGMIVFCSFEQIPTLINAAKKHGFVNYIPLVFCKNYSPQVLKANMRIVGATEYALVFYRGRLPKFRNGCQQDENGKNIRGTGRMIFNWFTWEKDGKEIPKIHPAQKPVAVIKKLIKIFTDDGDVVIDPCAGSGSTLRAAMECGRNSYGF